MHNLVATKINMHDTVLGGHKRFCMYVVGHFPASIEHNLLDFTAMLSKSALSPIAELIPFIFAI